MTDASDAPEFPGVMTALLGSLSDGSCRTMDELAEVLPLTRRQISHGATRLILRDYAERVEIGCYRLTPTGMQAAENGEAITCGGSRPHKPNRRRAPRRNSLRQRLWNAMRMSGAFTLGDLIMAAASDSDTYPEQNAACYINKLRRAGYLLELSRRLPGTALTSNGIKQYRLIRNTGPVAPGWNPKLRIIRDRNTGEDVPCSK